MSSMEDRDEQTYLDGLKEQDEARVINNETTTITLFEADGGAKGQLEWERFSGSGDGNAVASSTDRTTRLLTAAEVDSLKRYINTAYGKVAREHIDLMSVYPDA